ncbi:hypothetical protein BH11PAT2_BH11PAT2_01670 [soil metagenome]
MTIDELGAMMVREFNRIHEKFTHVDERFDRVETRLMRVEEICENLTGRFISMDDRLSKLSSR